VRVGVTLPSFRDDPHEALEAARRAEALGLDGVFAFDHLWPMGRPERPALSAFPLLGAVAGITSRIALGTLVARIGLVPDDVLVAQLVSLERMAPGRVVAGLGTGDAKSAAENKAFGVGYPPADDRRLELRSCATRLRDAGIPVWIGGGSTATTRLAGDLGVAVNLWEGHPTALAALQTRCEVTWGGPLRGDVPAMAEWLSEIRRAGASWAVCAWPSSLERLAEAAAIGR
jgi:alkanesulfonate monooxygenase SsuD/methylene tetrahydromethanopterin reductase-like flavin-dependent oxidoreductase (luciferase family)